VAADNGIVTLTGQVHHCTENVAAEDAAKEVFGVKGIANDIKVEPEGSLTQTAARTLLSLRHARATCLKRRRRK
jgi:osmotically-inducible protein OsmY